MKTYARRRGRVRAVIGAVMAVTMMAGPVQPAAAADPPVVITDADWGAILFSAGMTLKTSGVALDKDVIASAELLDWRAKNPTADARTARMHLAVVRSGFNSQLTAEQSTRAHSEVLRRLTTITYNTSGVVITGRQMTDLLALVTGRHLTQAMPTVEQRLTGVQQNMDLDIAFRKFTTSVWTSVRNKATTDAVFASVWNEQIGAAQPGQPFSLSANASLDTMKALPGLNGVVNVDALKAAAAGGKQALIAEAMRQAAPLIDQSVANHDKLTADVQKAEVENPKPGSTSPPPSQEKVDQAKKDMEQRQDYLDKFKGGYEFLAGVVKKGDNSAGSQFIMFAEAMYKLGGAANKIIHALQTIGVGAAVGSAVPGIGTAIGAIIGAAVGLIQVIGGLLGGGGERAAQQQVLDAVNRGFANVQKNLSAIYTTMNKRFDRIDASLDMIYQRMQVQFNELMRQILTLQANVSQVHDLLLTLQTQLTSFVKATLDGLSDNAKRDFLQKVNDYIDYPAKNDGRTIPNENDTYGLVAGKFQFTGTNIATETTFTQDASSNDPRMVLTSKGPAGAVDWLAAYSNSKYGTTFDGSLSSRTPNVDLWAEAARAYYLLALQNPQHARDEGTAQVRANLLIEAGRKIQRATNQFSTPDHADGRKVNKTFNGLHQDYKDSLATFTSEVLAVASSDAQRPDSPVMYRDRKFNLWDPYKELTLEQGAQLPKSATSTPPCNGNGSHTNTFAMSGDGSDSFYGIGARYRAALWMEPNWSVQSCYNSADPIRVGTTESCNAPYYTRCEYHFHYELKIWVKGFLAGMPGGPYHTEWAHGIRYFNPCNWVGPRGTPAPASCGHADTTPPSLDSALRSSLTVHRQRASDQLADAADFVGPLLAERRARYYELVATHLKENRINAVHNLNNTTMLYQAYTDLGLPRAKQNDDQLHALLYGSYGLPAETPGMPGTESPNLILSAIYTEAAQKQRAEGINSPLRLEWLNDGFPIDCKPLGTVGSDPVGNCVKNVGEKRADRLHDRVRLHFQAIANGTETESLPLVDEAVDNLVLARTYAKVGKETGDPIPPAPAVNRQQN